VKGRTAAPPVQVTAAEFWALAEPGRTLPPPEAPEVAFGGRSNVGKSSLLGTLTGRSKLVRVSNTPGRTRGVVLFKLATNRGPVVFADLPGYGYARVPREMQLAWGPLVEGYLSGRGALRAMIALVDLRRGFEPDDAELLDFAAAYGLDVLVVGTKMDKLPKARRKPAVAALAAGAKRHTVGTSTVTGEGIDDVWRWIAARAFRPVGGNGTHETHSPGAPRSPTAE
jgi:GTP-binding protein